MCVFCHIEEREFPSKAVDLQHRAKGEKRLGRATYGIQRGFSRAGTRDDWAMHTDVSSLQQFA
ncbi:hypothetical protein PAL_GLEAN10004380 [Pteropus alecto]|uniref:Uncharacterized protein n=1 Tax=Pteropus alecto TaxID=9402 RepID=L5L711_PTEAL|nr:hypothetical protein PAL_GLEAN10004380 [Pteropus alecto]